VAPDLLPSRPALPYWRDDAPTERDAAAFKLLPPGLLRALMAELERLANHFGDIGAICNDASFAIMHAQCGILRERTLRAADGLQAELQAEGTQPAELLDRIEAVPAQRQFHQGDNVRCALRQRLPPKGGDLVLREAEARGARTVSGRWMLIHQAAEQVRLLTGREAPIAALIEGFESG